MINKLVFIQNNYYEESHHLRNIRPVASGTLEWQTDYYEFRFEDQNQNKKHFYKWDGAGLRYEIQEFVSCIYNHRPSSARRTQRESIAMADVIGQFKDRPNFYEL